MREYYSVLGVDKNASESEIISAYRKLAAKFNPDANANDPFFADRFRELQEAFNTLINPTKRAEYNSNLDPKFAQSVDIVKDKEKPIITVFEISKKSITEAEPVTVRWQTIHASEIKIDLIGNVEVEGTKTLRIPFENKAFLRIAIYARNAFLNETVSKFIDIKNKDFDETKIVAAAIQKQEIISEQISTVKKAELKTEDKELKKEQKVRLDQGTKEIKKKPVEIKSDENVKRKERALTKEERLEGLKIAYEEETSSKAFKKRDLYVYIVLIVLLVFVVIMLVFAYSLNPIV